MKTRLLNLVICLALLSLHVGIASAALPPHQKLMAKRAAELDAYRNMTERIMGLRIDSDSTVVNFVGESDRIATSMDHFIKGLRIDDDQTSWYDDGTCEVVVEVSLSKVIKELKTSYDKYYKGRGKWKTKSFEKIKTYTEKRVLTEIGVGAVRRTSLIPEPETVPVVLDFMNPRDKHISLPAIYSRYPPKNRLMAKRIATVDAYRKLAERIYGLRIRAQTTVRDFDVNMSSDIIRGRLNHHLKGMRIDEVRYQEDGIVEVQVSLTLKQIVTVLKLVCDEYYNETGKRIKSKLLKEITKHADRKTITVLGMGAITGKSNETQSTSGMQGQPTGRGTRTTTTIIIEEPEVIEIK